MKRIANACKSGIRRCARKVKWSVLDGAAAAQRRCNNLLRPPPWLDGRCGQYRLLRSEPPIFYLGHWNDYGGVQRSMEPLFDELREMPVTLFIGYFWQLEDDRRVQLVRRMYDIEHVARYPRHRVVHVCNTPRQLEMFQAAGMQAVYASRAALSDERIYRPLAETQRRFDAVYDARLLPYKRHELAVRVPRLALVSGVSRYSENRRYAQQMLRQLGDVHQFNRTADGGYRWLSAEEVAQAYNQCRVGLCLSQTEGVMFASIQYLLAGLPVVSIRSGGGRDLLYDERTALTVDDDPDAVREGVAELIRRDLAPQDVRTITLEKVNEHRGRLVAAIQQVYDEQGVVRSAAADWPDYFCDKLCRTTQHADTLATLRNGAPDYEV